MALRRGTHTLNQENDNCRFIAKSHLVKPVEPTKRPALGELGNRINTTQKLKENSLKQNGHMGPPETILNKAAQPAKKEIIKNVADNSAAIKKKQLLREESILKSLTVNTVVCRKVSSISSTLTKQASIDDPDVNVKNDPQMVTEYLMDIFSYLRELETKLGVREDFLEGHESNPRMRTILVNWLVEVHANFKFMPETLYLCVAIIDRYLQENKKIGKSTLQLVGTSALLVACKYEEIYAPDLEDFEYICDNTFTKKEILQMEKEILKRLDFNVGNPSSIQFLRRYNKIAQARLDHHILGKYFLELALMEYKMCHIKPSIQAAAACCLSMGILNDTMDLQKVWTPTLAYYTSYEYYDIRPVIAELAMLIVKSEKSKYESTKKKYASAKFSKMSLNPKLNGPLVKKLTAGKK